MVTKFCGQCDRPFEVKASHAHKRKNCSRKCMGLARSNQVEVTCTQCEATFYRPRSRVRKNNFCNRACSGLWHSKIVKVCSQCNEPFEVPQYEAQRVYCGRGCADAARTIHPIVQITCDYCRASFERRSNKVKSHNFCNKTCYRAWFSENIRGEAHHNYIDGRSIKYPDDFDPEFRAAIKRRDGYKCALCSEKGTDVHHINYDKEDTSEKNCVLLCRSCHSKTNGNRIYWQKVLTDYMAGQVDVSIKPAGWREDLTEKVLLDAFEKRGSIRQMSDELSIDRRAIKRTLDFYGYQVVRRRANKGYGWDNYLERIAI